MSDEFYDINKIRIVLIRNPFSFDPLCGFGGDYAFIRQFMYFEDGVICDIFKDKYIDGIYDKDGEIVNFSYNSINRISLNYLNDFEKNSGLISYDRLLQIYCHYNKYFISYEYALSLDKHAYDNVINLNRYVLRRKKDNLISYNEEVE